MNKLPACLSIAMVVGAALSGCAAPTRSTDPSALRETKYPH